MGDFRDPSLGDTFDAREAAAEALRKIGRLPNPGPAAPVRPLEGRTSEEP